MNIKLLLTLLAAGLMVLSIGGCSDDDDPPTDPGDTNIFAGYRDLNQVDNTNAPSALLGPAHNGNNGEFTRSIFTSAAAMLDTGEYEEGTIFVKETHTYDADADHMFADPMGLLAMVKREVDFDEAGNDWEYFNLDPSDLSTIASGADLGACKGCHMQATADDGNDFIFMHPMEFEPDPADFDDYATWTLIGTEQGPDAALGPAHEGNDADAVRRIYKKQLAANPAGLGDGYPTGTLVLKEVRSGTDAVIGKTGMAKRGGDFDATNDNWEYFMWDPASGDLAVRGAVVTCIGCHTAANSAGMGADWVFAHDDDPFNN